MVTKMSIKKCFFVIVFLALVMPTSVQAADVAGTWKAEFDTQIGVQKYTFTFQQNNNRVTGKATSNIAGQEREVTLQDVKLDQDLIMFFEILDFQGNAIQIDYLGKISASEINFTRDVGDYATEEFVAKRAGRSEIGPSPEASVTTRSVQSAERTPRPGREPGVQTPRPGQLRMPRPGPCPLPILPALPAYDDREFYTEKNVPHGEVEQVAYTNHAGQEKRMHIYLPPGYRNDNAGYPVLYLNHGGGDDDSKWTNTDPRNGGHAQFILDNLIAAGKAKPMIVVMPNTRGIASPNPPVPGQDDACTKEFLKDIIPYVESHYRIRPGRENRALAGLSMGGFVVMNTGLSHLDTFSELYVYSSGYIGDQQKVFEENFKELFQDSATNNLFRVPFYMAAGETDIALLNSQKTLAVLNAYGIRNFWVLSSGGHEWANWRRYLHQTVQIMFPSSD